MEFFEFKFDESFVGYRLGDSSDVGCSAECDREEHDIAKRVIAGGSCSTSPCNNSRVLPNNSTLRSNYGFSVTNKQNNTFSKANYSGGYKR